MKTYKSVFKFSLLAIAVMLMMVIGSCSSGTKDTSDTADTGTQQAAEVVHNVTAQQAHDVIADNADITILDARTADEYNSGHVENAVNIDFYSPTYVDELKKLDRNATYLVYCRSGNRSAAFVQTMESLGFTDIYHMMNGIIEWNANGLPVVGE